jgi:hypothetical protein
MAGVGVPTGRLFTTAVRVSFAPGCTTPLGKVIDRVGGGGAVIITCAVALCVVSALAIAVTVTVVGLGTEAGAV